MATWKLTIEDDEGQKTVVPLVRDEYTLGRREGHTLRLTERNVSRDHARVRREAEGFALDDLGSYNGVFVNGHRVPESRKLASGDLILIGDYRIEVHDDDQAARAIALAPVPVPIAAAATATAPPTSIPAVDAPRARVVQLSGDDAGRESILDKPRALLGRGDDVVVIVNHSSVSRHHCELRVLEDRRVEVVDLASANGVRLGGKETRKGLLSPGEVFEVGDVIMKYVAAGDRFVFDVSAAEAARAAIAKTRVASGSSPLAWIVALVVIGSAAAGGILLARQGGDSSDVRAPSAKPSSASGLTSATLEAIDRAVLKQTGGDLDAAHAVLKDLGETTRLRTDKRYADIEDRWARQHLDVVASIADTEKRTTVLNDVIGSGAAKELKERAGDLLAAKVKTPEAAPETLAPDPLPLASASTLGALTSVPTGEPASIAPGPSVKPVTSGAIPKAALVGPTTAATTATASTPTSPTAVGCATFKGDYAAANRAGEYGCVRAMLLPALNSGTISSLQAKYLKAACVSLGDQACAARAAQKL